MNYALIEQIIKAYGEEFGLEEIIVTLPEAWEGFNHNILPPITVQYAPGMFFKVKLKSYTANWLTAIVCSDSPR